MYFYLLELPRFFKETGPMDVVYFGIGLGVIIIILVIVNHSKERLGISDSIFVTPRAHHIKRFAIHNLARSIGLDSSQSKMLAFVMKDNDVTDPEQALQSSELLDKYFKKSYSTIEETADSSEEIQKKLAMFFATRNILEAASGGGAGVNSTRVIPENTPAVLTVGEDKSYPIRVLSSQGAYLLVENPTDAPGEPVSIDRNTPVTLSFYTKSSNGFSVDSTVSGTTKVPGEGQVLQVVHSNTIKRLSKRRFRRRQIAIPVEFNMVRLEPGPRKREQRMVVEKKKGAGNILDISIGGCSIQTGNDISAGSRLRIGFAAGKRHVVALGEVLRTNRNRISTIMHIKFLKVPRQSLNLINALVFEYLEG
jgi:hypothetical protein